MEVVVGFKKPLRLSAEVQTNSEPKIEQGTQCGTSRGSYNRNKDHDKWRYDDLMAKMVDKEILIEWRKIHSHEVVFREVSLAA